MARYPLQVIKFWRRHLNDRTATDLLQQYGVPGLLTSGGVILGKLTQLGSPTDLHIQLEVMLYCGTRVQCTLSWTACTLSNTFRLWTNANCHVSTLMTCQHEHKRFSVGQLPVSC